MDRKLLKSPTPAVSSALVELLERIDGAPYRAYRELLGEHPIEQFVLIVDRVPPDPFAGGARIRIRIDRAAAGVPEELIATADRRMALEDDIARRAGESLEEFGLAGPRRGGGTGGISIDPPGPAVIRRSSCRVDASWLELRCFVDLPAHTFHDLEHVGPSRAFAEDRHPDS